VLWVWEIVVFEVAVDVVAGTVVSAQAANRKRLAVAEIANAIDCLFIYFC